MPLGILAGQALFVSVHFAWLMHVLSHETTAAHVIKMQCCYQPICPFTLQVALEVAVAALYSDR
jgi:hypothetical protein